MYRMTRQNDENAVQRQTDFLCLTRASTKLTELRENSLTMVELHLQMRTNNNSNQQREV